MHAAGLQRETAVAIALLLAARAGVVEADSELAAVGQCKLCMLRTTGNNC